MSTLFTTGMYSSRVLHSGAIHVNFVVHEAGLPTSGLAGQRRSMHTNTVVNPIGKRPKVVVDVDSSTIGQHMEVVGTSSTTKNQICQIESHRLLGEMG